MPTSSRNPTSRWILLLLLALLVPAGPALAVPGDTAPATEAAGASSYLAKLPPLIDRQVFFGNPEIAGAQVSPDGKWISFLKPFKDEMNIWVKGIDAPFDAARPITADTKRPVRIYFWTRDSRFILYAQDKGGNENFHVYAVDPKGEAAEGGVPVARDLTPLENVRAMIFSVPKSTPGQIIVGLNDRDPSAHDVYRIDIDTGKRELVYKNEGGFAAFLTDLGGNLRLGWHMTDDGGSEIVEVTGAAPGKVLYSCAFEESCQPIRFDKSGKKFYLRSNKGADVDLQRLMLYDLDSGKAELVESDPEKEVDFGGALFSEKTDELIGTVYIGDRQRVYPRSKQLAKDLKFLRSKLPDGELGMGSTTKDERLSIVSVSRDVNPGSVYLYDRKARKVTKLYDSRPKLPVKDLAPMEPVRYKARDGVEIPAYLTLPKGAPAHNLPAILLPHGGPWARDTWGYDGFAQFLANRGYAVLQPNFRGSTGYGKAFLNGGNNGWGTGVMQHDLTDAVKYLIGQGIADPKRFAIMGGSYGGYATLAGVTFTPDLYAAGVSIVGPSNIISLFESIPPYWKPIRKMFLLRVGDPDKPEDRKRLVAQSPFFHARQIKAPLLVIQGANDPRVNKAESDQIVVALRDLKRPVEYLVAPDEGHGFAGEENRLAMFAVIEKFLAEHVDGRYQESATPEVAQRIKELVVDVSTVKMPQAPKGAEAAKSAPLPAPREGGVAPLSQTFSTTLDLPNGQQTTVKGTRTVSAEMVGDAPGWRVVNAASGAMGQVEDIYLLDGKSLTPRHRSVKQGPVSVEVDFSESAIKGTIKTPQGEMPVNLALEAPVFGDDAALGAVMGALPLTPDYKTAIRTFDLQSQKVRRWSLAVIGTEKTTVPAGEFETYELKMTPLDQKGGGGTFWISKSQPTMVVRYEISIPTPIGAISGTGELQSYEVP